MTLHELFETAVEAAPDGMAVLDPARERSITYSALDELVGSLADDLARFGVGEGRRVGILAPKSIGVVASILATLRSAAAYVPADSGAPLSRAAEIFMDCEVDLVVVQRDLVEPLRSALGESHEEGEFETLGRLREMGSDLVPLIRPAGDSSPVKDLAYILYTSGSTGKPKGVMHTNASARCFVDWCSETFEPEPTDRFSSHAPFHFDLSVLDLYVPMAHGATIVLIGEEEGKNPLRLATLISSTGISVWYSTPSVLRLLVEHGKPGLGDATDLRLVLFAGEVFAPGHLRRLQQVWPSRRYFNLYGPTETNVCTYYEIQGEVPSSRVEPYPIGKSIRGDRTLVLDERSVAVAPGAEGELLVHGGTVMAGYWGCPELSSRAFYHDNLDRHWYRTGDIVRENEEGDLVFLGRRDRMIKRRGYRVELGEIESVLYRHSEIREAAVVAVSDPSEGVRVKAYVCWGGSGSPSTIALKRFCAENLPLYMVPDGFTLLDQLPKTSTDKIDYQYLASP